MDDGRVRQAQAASGKLRAEIDGSGGAGGGVAYEARGYKQGWADERAEDRQADGGRPQAAKIALCAILACLWKRCVFTWSGVTT